MIDVYSFLSKFTFKQLVIIFLILVFVVCISGFGLYKFYLHINEDQIKSKKIKNGVNKTYEYLKKNKYINSKSLTDDLTKNIFNIEEKNEDNEVKRIQDKYYDYLTDDFFIKSKLDKIKHSSFLKNDNLECKKIGLKVLKRMFNNNILTSHEDGCLIIFEDGILYLDFYVELQHNKGMGIIFSPLHKVSYFPNSLYNNEEEFLIQRHIFNKDVKKAFLNGVYILEIPEKIYNLEYNEHTQEWFYFEKELEEVNEDVYYQYLMKYIEESAKIDNNKFNLFNNSVITKKPNIYF